MLRFNNIVLICLLFSAAASCTASEKIDTTHDSAALKHWQDMRFGMFIHWGPVSLTGHEIGWSRGRQTPIEEYDRLYKRFNPTKFNADQWVRVAKEAGMKYLVLTTKHHDGFCLWPSKYTDYHIGNGPFKRDVVGELAKACKKQGIRFGTYYSVCDWYHPDYPKGSPAGKTDKPNPDMDGYIEYLRNQVTELITNYGPLSTMWFDVPREVYSEHGKPTVELVRQLQPDILINNRAYLERERDWAHRFGDYTTPEQKIGDFNRQRPWETCMTICRQWAWKPNDNMKSLKECIQTLLYTVGGDGNLLFNVGPMPDGRIEPRQVERLKEMGAWLKKHGNTVYGTRGGPFKPGKWGASTCKDNKIYLFIMNWPKERPLQIPALSMKITDVAVKTGGTLKVNQTKEMIELDIPQDNRDPIATVIELTVDGKAFEIQPVNVALYKSNSVAFGQKNESFQCFLRQ
jgi:alpha-L-fucosidase